LVQSRVDCTKIFATIFSSVFLGIFAPRFFREFFDGNFEQLNLRVFTNKIAIKL
jgi:hypothetical protein